MAVSKHFDLRQVCPGVFAAIAIDGGHAISNAGLIDLGGRALVYDTFMTPQAARDLRQAAAEHTGRSASLVINSHYHNDHIWGNQVFAEDAAIIASRRTRELIATEGAKEYAYYSANAVQQFAGLKKKHTAAGPAERVQIALWLGYYEGLVEALPSLRVCPPTVTFEDRLEVHGTRRSASLISFTGAHTGHDTILYLPEAGIVFASDLLFVGCHPYLPDGNPFELLKVVRAVQDMKAEQFIPGHGPVGTREDLVLLLEYIEHCIETADSLVKTGAALAEPFPSLPIPERYRAWILNQFYSANLRFLCKWLSSGKPTG